MKVRLSVAGALAVALAFGATSTASAQSDTTRRTTSQTRVRVTKESTGEVAVKRDSAFIRDSIARADSITRMEKMRQDSITLAERERARLDSISRDSASRADSIARATPPAPPPAATTDTIRSPVTPSMSSESYGLRKGGWYLGLAGGAAVPTSNISDFYKPGFGVYVPIGYQRIGSPLGFRIDLGYARFNGKEPGSTGLSFQPDDPNIWSGTANLTLDVIRWGESRRGALYLVGGGGVYRFTNFFSGDRNDNEVQSAFQGKPTTRGGVTGGAGLSVPVGGASLFVESRYTNAYTQGEETKWIPVIVGLKWR